MSDHSQIEWTDATWNPVTGCSHVSEGCRHCYAEALSLRRGWSKLPWTAPNASKNVVLHPERLEQPYHWREPRRVFVNSMSDLFHELIPDGYIATVFHVMAVARRHTFQVLTKRAERMRAWFDWFEPVRRSSPEVYGADWPVPNVQLGVSCEDQRAAEARIPHLLETPAAVRFISAEPLLGPITVRQSWVDYLQGWVTEPVHVCGGDAERCARQCPEAQQVQTEHLDWVIVGGESGLGFRRPKAAWVLALRDQCVDAGVPFFFKQWGGRTPKAGGRELEGRTWDQMPPRGTP